ncbi:hypothetical protein LWI28_015175 [Acer negundo]|uniref:Homeobox protein knotted-1-like 1 n=1 Tax=Acer negundo TaxID=4023 RepID=A0AAD5NXF5_ACENE|nr:hypothetical protein LWI28_015175 [Acer negundo]
MENFYRHDHHQYSTTISSSSCASDHDNNTNIISHGEDNNIYAAATTSQFHSPIFGGMIDQFDHRHQSGTGFEESSSEICDLIKSQIANHPRYPNLVSAFVECQKVGAPPEMATVFEEISREIYSTTSRSSDRIGADPELDQFMEQYCEVLHRYKEELSKPFDEATTFLNNIQSQLNNLCNGTFTRASSDYPSDEAAGTSEEEQSYGEGEAPECQESSNSNSRSGDQYHQGSVKGMLMRKYSGHLSSLRKEFLKKRKKGKLPKDARTALLDWWNSHFRWPYPTEDEKAKLSEETGLDQRQINNWFINQRKRHWKPSEDMRFALMEGVTTSSPNYNNDNIGQPVDDEFIRFRQNICSAARASGF